MKTTKESKSPEMENFLNNISLKIFGRSRILAIVGAQCVMCGQPATEFRDELSRKEFNISGLCSRCQCQFFDVDMTDEG